MTSPGHLCALDRLGRAHPSDTFLVVAAHPDDEVIGLGATLGALVARGSRVQVLHVTDGAPRDPSLRPALRDCTPSEAAAVRAREVAASLRAGGLDPGAILVPSLGVPDQEASLAMVEIARGLSQRFEELTPNVVITHPYEGGHPDHDAVALAVHAAVRIISARRGAPLRLAEMSSYHASREGDALEAATFLPCPHAICTSLREGHLDERSRARKRAMLDAFTSQAEVLAGLGGLDEPLRCAPPYDFTEPPHAGVLHYERLAFGWTGERWRTLAREAWGALSESS